MSLTQQLRVWFSWNLQEKAFKQTLSISKVESELRMKTPSQFEGSQIFEEATDPNFTSIRNQKSFLNLFLFCRCMSDKILTELKVLVLAAPLGSSWIEPRPTTVRHLKEKHFWKSIYQYTLLSSAKNKTKKIKGWDSESHGPSSDQRSSQMLIWQPALRFQWTQTRCFVCVWDFKDKTSKAQKMCSFWRRSLASMWPRWPLTCRKTLCSLSDRRLQRLQKGEKVSKPPLRAERGCRPTRVL